MREGMSFDEALDKAAGTRTFQSRALFAAGLALAECLALLSATPYILRTPSLKCQSAGTTFLVECSEEELCAGDMKFIFDWRASRSIVFEWNLICGRSFYTYVIAVCFALCFALGVLVFSYLGERHGRLSMLKWSLALSNFIAFILFCSASVWFFIVVFSALGACLGGMLVEPFVYIVEVSEATKRPKYLLSLFVCGFLGGLVAVLSFEFFRTWRAVVVLALGLGLCALGLCGWFLVESPRFLAFNLSRYSKVKKVLDYMCTVNGAPVLGDSLQGERMNEYSESLPVEENEVSMRDLAVVPGDYIGGLSSVQEREKDILRGEQLNYWDLMRLDALRWKTLGLLHVTVAFALVFWAVRIDIEQLVERTWDVYIYPVVELGGVCVGFVLVKSVTVKGGLLGWLLATGVLAMAMDIGVYFEVVERWHLYPAVLFTLGAAEFSLVFYVISVSATPIRNLRGGMIVAVFALTYIACRAFRVLEVELTDLLAGALLVLACIDFLFLPGEDFTDFIDEDSTVREVVEALKHRKSMDASRAVNESNIDNLYESYF